MRHTSEELTFQGTRKRVLLQDLERICDTMTGDAIPVLTLLSGEDEKYQEERAECLATRLADLVDELQKAYYLMHGEVELDAAAERAIGASPAWQEVLSRMGSLDDRLALSLAKAPTTMSQAQRDLVRDFFYCELRACSCPALEMDTIKSLRRVAHKTSRLTRGWEGPDGPVRTGLAHHDLLARELYNDAQFGREPSLGVMDDLFDVMDALYGVLEGASPTQLEPEGALEEFYATKRGAQLRQMLEWGRVRVWGELAVRELCGTGLAKWRALDHEARVREALRAFEALGDEELATVFDGNPDLHGEMDALVMALPLDRWHALDRAERLGELRRALDDLPDHDDEADALLRRQEEEVMGREHRLREDIRSWFANTGGTDLLFRRYAAFRKGFSLPRGCPSGRLRASRATRAGVWPRASASWPTWPSTSCWGSLAFRSRSTMTCST